MDLENTTGTCEVCGADDLIHRGSQAVCPHCGTAIDTQQTSVALDDATQYRYLNKILVRSQSTDQAKVQKRERVQPWKLSEGFQCLLLKQIASIESALNLPKDYREMVLKVWMLYLKATGEAFISPNDRDQCRYPLGWGWIYDPEEGEEMFRKLMLVGGSDKRTLRPMDGKLEKVRQQLESQEALRKLEFEVGDNPLSSSSSDSDEDIDLDFSLTLDSVVRKRPNPSLQSFASHQYWRGWLGDTKYHCLLLEFNLAVCYVPLLYMEVQGRSFGMCDLLEAIHKHGVPYHNARASLPNWICIRDRAISHYFKRWQVFPDRHLMCKVVKRLLSLIGIEEFPKFSLLTHIDQQIINSRLPLQIGRFAKNIATMWMTADIPLMKKRERMRNMSSVGDMRSTFVSADNFAASFVLFAVLVLRGVTSEELKYREATVLVLRKLTRRDDLFSFGEWQNSCLHFMNKNRPPKEEATLETVLNLPSVGCLLGQKEDIDEGEEVGRGAVGVRAIQKHESVPLVKKKSFAKEMMTPFQPLIQWSIENEMERSDDWCFSNHIMCYPRDKKELRTELNIDDIKNTSLNSEDLFYEEESPAIEELLAVLPSDEDIAENLTKRFPKTIPKDLEGIVKIIAWNIYERPEQLWAETVMLQNSIMANRGQRGRTCNRVDAAASKALNRRTFLSLT